MGCTGTKQLAAAAPARKVAELHSTTLSSTVTRQKSSYTGEPQFSMNREPIVAWLPLPANQEVGTPPPEGYEQPGLPGFIS